MSEMELMCDRVGIIANGKMIGTYTMEELVSQASDKTIKNEIEVDDVNKALSVVDLPDTDKSADAENGIITLKIPVEGERDMIADIIGKLVTSGVRVYSSHKCENKKLEDVFIELTRSQKGDGQIG